MNSDTIERIIHIEPTTRCTISCSQCPRTYHAGEYAVVDCDIHSTARLCRHFGSVFMCGNHGDPIYHAKFHELIIAIRQMNPSIRIGMHTNGCHRTAAWWLRLGSLLTHPRDSITFSIDGLPNSNHVYRQGSHWPSINEAITTLRANFPQLILKWKWIVFRYNQDQIREGMHLARELGFNDFKVVWSDRYGPDDELTPTISKEHVITEVRAWHESILGAR